MISDKKWEQLMHDLKRLSKGVRIMMREDDAGKRELIGSLLFDETERIRADLEELKNNGNGKEKKDDNS